MLNRRGFLRHSAAASVMCVGCGLRHAFAQAPATAPRREVMVGGRRIRTVDVHAHAAVPAVLDVVNGTPFEREAKRQLEADDAAGCDVGVGANGSATHRDVDALGAEAFVVDEQPGGSSDQHAVVDAALGGAARDIGLGVGETDGPAHDADVEEQKACQAQAAAPGAETFEICLKAAF